MLDRYGRHIDAEQATGLARVIAGRADDVFGHDFAAVGRELPFTAGRALRPR
jgi:hypothetical protein